MSKNKGNGGGQDNSVEGTAANVESAAPGTVGPNFVLTYRRDHPGDRCSYGIAGNAGIVVFDKGLFKDGVAPPTITLDCEMVPVKADNKTAKAEAAAAKLAEKAAKAQAKIEAATARAAEKAVKAQEAAAKAQAKAEAVAKAKAEAAEAAAKAATPAS